MLYEANEEVWLISSEGLGVHAAKWLPVMPSNVYSLDTFIMIEKAVYEQTD